MFALPLAFGLFAGSIAQAPSPSSSPQATPVAVATPAVSSSRAAGLVLPPVPNVGPTPNLPANALPSGDLVGTSGPFVALALSDAIGMAMARNTDLGVAQSNRRIAGYQIVAAEGAYDLHFTVQPTFTFSQIPSVSSFQAGPNGSPAKQSVSAVGANVGGATASGGQFSIGTSASRTNSTTTINSYDPYYQTALQLSYTQPLARGAAIDNNRRQLQLARVNASLSSDAALLSASNVLTNVLNAYYDLVAAWKNVAIQEDALRQAKAQSESNARLVKQGAAARVDVIESDTQVSVFQDDVYSAIQNVGRLQNQLKALILTDPSDPIWTANLVPTTPRTDVPAEPKLDDVVVAAIRGRPEIAQLRDTMRSADVNVAYAKEQTKPQIDLNLGAGETGFAGQAANPNLNPLTASSAAQINAINATIARVNATTPAGLPPLQTIPLTPAVTPPYTIGGLGQSYSNLFTGKYPSASIGATISFPFRNRTAEAEYAIAREQRAQLATQEVGLIQRIQSEARNTLQTYRSARSRLLAAQAGRAAAEEVAASELRRFKAGQSTTFLVLQRQVNLATQRGRELQAETDVQKALVELDRVTGNLLPNNNVDVSTLGTKSR